MFDKELNVAFCDNKLRLVYDNLKFGSFEDKQLHKKIEKVIDELKMNPFYGIQIPKRLIPKEYISNYAVQNLWKINLTFSWRLIYTITQTEIIIVSVILDWFSHKEYERKFKYKR
jgi:Txe/YoeB family toxin of Txe-Axe toxin-antitoxin module